jgi:hypothetical protein
LSALFLPVHRDTESQRLFCAFAAPVCSTVIVAASPRGQHALGLKGVGC